MKSKFKRFFCNVSAWREFLHSTIIEKTCDTDEEYLSISIFDPDKGDNKKVWLNKSAAQDYINNLQEKVNLMQ